MLGGLTIIIIASIVLGAVTSVASKSDEFIMTSGIMFTVFGLTALFWVARVTTPYLRKDSGLLWLYKPLASLPEWMGHAGLGATAVLWILAIVFLVDDYIHLPRRRKGGHC
ncbi:hypothetical protein [Candidatus Nanosynbacter lyticus]|uniref:hypothetical protein n=1 Tax=Candidatus Nanosynbacter lyticus TaxID=2093824 RepID=UPI00255442A4|nr:hypothetical protein [Candidatus Nanosynbacter lyticus]WLD46898.1 hypothetical protein NLML1_0530 [Candidatus Nanosynbacter lyticus]